jgi:hypothetical protein
MPSSGNAETVYTVSGYKNWKDLSAACKRHFVESESHREAEARWSAAQQASMTGSVYSQINSHHMADVERNRAAVCTLVRSLLYCARQGIRLRGHRELHSAKDDRRQDRCDDDGDDNNTGTPSLYNRGNFCELLSLIKLESPDTAKKTVVVA